MAATIATITPYLKEVYQGRIREQLNNDVKTLKRITRSSSGVTTEVNGKYVTFPVHTTRNSGIGSRLEMEPLPTPGQQGFAAARLALKYGYAGIQLTGQAISLSDSDPKAFAKVLDQEMDGLKNDVQKDMNRQVYGDGTGAIGVVSATGTTVNTVTVSDARLFQRGELVDIVTLPSTVAVTARTVTAINVSTGVVTLSGAAFSSAIGQIVVRNGSGPSASGNREMTGFGAIVSATGTLYNIDPTVETEWTAEVNANGGTLRALSEGLMIQMADRIRTRGGKTSVIFQSLGVRRAYFNLLSQQRQVVNEQKFTGGFTGLAFTTDDGEIPAVADVDAPLSTMYFINEDDITYYHDEDWHWLDRDGSMWKQVRDTNGDYDAWYARFVEYHELGTDRRNTHGVIKDITEG
jgi:hypothetical protein